MDKNHPLTAFQSLTFDQVINYPLVLFSETFSTSKYIMDQFRQRQMKVDLLLSSTSWEYLIDMVKGNQNITFLPKSTYSLMDKKSIIYRSMEDPLEFNIFLSRKLFTEYTPNAKIVYDELIDYCGRITQAQQIIRRNK